VNVKTFNFKYSYVLVTGNPKDFTKTQKCEMNDTTNRGVVQRTLK